MKIRIPFRVRNFREYGSKALLVSYLAAQRAQFLRGIGVIWAVAAGAALFLTGCSSQVHQAINYYHEVAPDVRIGMSKEEALSILEPSATMLPADEQRPPERFTDQDGRLTEVYFFRSNAYYDDMLTDDEFTPYVFKDDKLTAIGWTALGGPKTQGLPYPRTTYHMGFGYGYHHW